MELIISRIVSEFNKIFLGTKRVGDTLRLKGKLEHQLDVLNSSKLGYKTESQLTVHRSLTSTKTTMLQSFDVNGTPIVNGSGEIVHIRENQLSVNNSQLLAGITPNNLEVDISRRLKVGNQVDSPIVNVENLITNPYTYTVYDSNRLNGKYESALNVSHALEADNAETLDGVIPSNLVVARSRITTKLISDSTGNPERVESELRVKSSDSIRRGTEDFSLFNIKEYVLGLSLDDGHIVDAKKVYTDLSASSNTLTSSTGNRSFDDIITYIKDDNSVIAYQSDRLITSNGAKTGDDYKAWILDHDDFNAAVGNTHANTSNRAVRFGSLTDNIDIDQLDIRIKNTNVTQASNASTLRGQTDEQIISTMRGRIANTTVSVGQTTLTQNEVTGYFGNNKVKLAVKDIKVNTSKQADALTSGNNSVTLAQIKQQVKDDGQVHSSKYIYSTPSSGGILKSYIDITNDITNANNTVIGSATSGSNTLGKLETIIGANTTSLSTSISNEATARNNADVTIQSNIDSETSRINTILLNAENDKDTFVGIKLYIDTVMGDLTTSSTDIGSNDTNMVNIANELESRISDVEDSTDTTVVGITAEVNRIENAVGLQSNGNFPSPWNAYNYINSASTIVTTITLLDSALKAEELARKNSDNSLTGFIGILTDLDTSVNSNIVAAINSERTRAKNVEGTLTGLSTNNKSSLVSALNELYTSLGTENTDGTNADDVLDAKIQTNISNIASEIVNRKNADGNLSSLNTTDKTNLVASINEVGDNVLSETNTRISVEGLRTNLNTSIKTTLVNAINEVNTKINQEVSNRTSADGNLSALNTTSKSNFVVSINELLVNMGDKSLLQTTNNGNFVAAINEIDSNISTETIRATNAENTIQGNVDAIDTAAQQATNAEKVRIDNTLSGLGFTDIDTDGVIEFTGTHYLDSASTIEAAFLTLDTKTQSNFNNIDNRIITIASVFDADDGTIDYSSGVTFKQSFHINDELLDPHTLSSSSTDGLVYDTYSLITNETVLSDGDGFSYLSNDGTYKKAEALFSNGTPSLTLDSDTNITLSAVDRVQVIGAPFNFPSFTTAERDTLTSNFGDMLYNTDTRTLQAFVSNSSGIGGWVDLHTPTA